MMAVPMPQTMFEKGSQVGPAMKPPLPKRNMATGKVRFADLRKSTESTIRTTAGTFCGVINIGVVQYCSAVTANMTDVRLTKERKTLLTSCLT